MWNYGDARLGVVIWHDNVDVAQKIKI